MPPVDVVADETDAERRHRGPPDAQQRRREEAGVAERDLADVDATPPQRVMTELAPQGVDVRRPYRADAHVRVHDPGAPHVRLRRRVRHDAADRHEMRLGAPCVVRRGTTGHGRDDCRRDTVADVGNADEIVRAQGERRLARRPDGRTQRRMIHELPPIGSNARPGCEATNAVTASRTPQLCPLLFRSCPARIPPGRTMGYQACRSRST